MRFIGKLNLVQFSKQDSSASVGAIRSLDHQRMLERIAQRGALLLGQVLDSSWNKAHHDLLQSVRELRIVIHEEKALRSAFSVGEPCNLDKERAEMLVELSDLLWTLCSQLGAVANAKKHEHDAWVKRVNLTIRNACVCATHLGVLIIEEGDTVPEKSLAVSRDLTCCLACDRTTVHERRELSAGWDRGHLHRRWDGVLPRVT